MKIRLLCLALALSLCQAACSSQAIEPTTVATTTATTQATTQATVPATTEATAEANYSVLESTQPIQNIILIIGDGMGDAQIDVGELGMGKTYVFRDWQRTHSNTNSLDASGRATKVTDSAAGGTALATARFIKMGLVNWRLAMPTIVTAIAGSSLGANASMAMEEGIMEKILFVVLPVTAFIVLNPKIFHDNEEKALVLTRRTWITALLSSFVVGLYDGFYGPGTGTFLIIALRMSKRYLHILNTAKRSIRASAVLRQPHIPTRTVLSVTQVYSLISKCQ